MFTPFARLARSRFVCLSAAKLFFYRARLFLQIKIA